MEALKEICPSGLILPESTEDDEGSEDGCRVSEEEYWERYYEHPYYNYEWNNGILEEVPVSDYAGYLMYLWFHRTLDHFLTVYPMGKMFALEMGFRLKMPLKTTIRKPDLSVVLDSNPAALHHEDHTYSGIVDICIEALSDSSLREIERDTVVKKIEYQVIGVQEYYILDAKKNETAFWRRNREKYRQIKAGPGGIIQSDVLPGFRFRLSDLYRQPSLKDMAEDRLYQEFILPFYQAEKQRAEAEYLRAETERLRADKEKQQAKAERLRADKEKHRAEAERLRAESAEQRAESAEKLVQKERERAENLAAKLRALGISPE